MNDDIQEEQEKVKLAYVKKQREKWRDLYEISDR
jgi:hypothetical protein